MKDRCFRCGNYIYKGNRGKELKGKVLCKKCERAGFALIAPMGEVMVILRRGG